MMRKMLINHPKNKYDWRHDILHMFLDTQYNSSADEEAPGVYVFRNDDDDHIVAFTIMDYSKNRAIVQRMYPNISFPVFPKDEIDTSDLLYEKHAL